MNNIDLLYSELNNNKLLYTYNNLTDYLILAKKYSLNKYISIYDKNRTLSKSKVSKLKNKFYLSYYCKNNICVKVDHNNLPEFIEIPDERGNIRRYINRSFSYKDVVLRNNANSFCAFYNTKNNRCQISISYKCTTDSQCLTNKCFNNYCVFNKETPTEFCTDIYSFSMIFGKRSYMHCGKAIYDICNNDEMCGSKNCMEGGICGSKNEPFSTDGTIEYILLIFLSTITIILLCFCYCIKLIIKYEIKKKRLQI